MDTRKIPVTYDELIRDYGPFIVSELKKRNKLVTNFEDVYQDICLKLIEARVIQTFHDRDQVPPETLTGQEAADFLGVRFHAFATRLVGYHHGHNRPGKGLVREKTPMPLPLTGKMGSVDATYRVSDIVDMLDLKWRHQGLVRSLQTLTAEPTPYQFLNYLGVAIRNHFNNWCRTRRRRWQDRTGDAVGGGDQVRFYTADGGYNDRWEETLKDDAHRHIESHVEFQQTLDRMATKGVNEAVQHEIVNLLADGFSIQTALEKSSLNPVRQRVVLRLFT